jgi:hypothetical protein
MIAFARFRLAVPGLGGLSLLALRLQLLIPIPNRGSVI